MRFFSIFAGLTELIKDCVRIYAPLLCQGVESPFGISTGRPDEIHDLFHLGVCLHELGEHRLGVICGTQELRHLSDLWADRPSELLEYLWKH